MIEWAWLRSLKGVLICVAFIGIGLGLLLEPDLGVAFQMQALGISPRFIGGWFIMSGALNAWIGLTNRSWNSLWFAVFFFYNGLTWVAVLIDPLMPVAPAFAYSLLSAFLIIDLFVDLRERQHSGTNKSR